MSGNGGGSFVQCYKCSGSNWSNNLNCRFCHASLKGGGKAGGKGGAKAWGKGGGKPSGGKPGIYVPALSKKAQKAIARANRDNAGAKQNPDESGGKGKGKGKGVGALQVQLQANRELLGDELAEQVATKLEESREQARAAMPLSQRFQILEAKIEKKRATVGRCDTFIEQAQKAFDKASAELDRKKQDKQDRQGELDGLEQELNQLRLQQPEVPAGAAATFGFAVPTAEEQARCPELAQALQTMQNLFTAFKAREQASQ